MHRRRHAIHDAARASSPNMWDSWTQNARVGSSEEFRREERRGRRTTYRIPFRNLLTLGIIVTLLLSAFPLTPVALAAYSTALTSPTPPAASTTFTWRVGGVKPAKGQEISHLELSGCWTAAQVASATALDKNNQPLTVEVHTGGPRANKIEVKYLSDASLPVTVQVAFHAPFGSRATGTALVLKTGKSSTTVDVGGPTCGPGNSLPAADDSAVTTAEDTPVQVTLTATDADSASLSFAVRSATRGSLGPVSAASCTTATGLTTCTATAEYTPSPNDDAPDSFTWTANDGSADSNVATVSITVDAVNDPPVFTDAAANTAQTISVGDGLVALQATDVDGDALSYTLSSGTLPAGITLNADGTFTGTANATSAGSTTATIIVSDGSGSTAETTLAVTVANTDAPAGVDLTISTFSARAEADGSVVLSVSVSNEGTAGTQDGFQVYFFAGTDTSTAPALRAEFEALVAGASSTLEYTWRTHALTPGEHTLAALVDGPQAVAETSETNNTGSTALEITTSAPAPEPIPTPEPEPTPQPAPRENLQAWGMNNFAQLGDGTTGWVRSQPEKVPGLLGVKTIAAGPNTSFAITGEGLLWAWGDNFYGQLGVPATDTCPHGPCSLQPGQVTGLNQVVAVAPGQAHTLAVTEDGTAWAWGTNSGGILGDGTYDNHPAPNQVVDITDVVAVAAGLHHSLALKSDGTIWAWGSNLDGSFGHDPIDVRESLRPRQVPGLSNIVALSSTEYHNLALKVDGTVWAWGENAYGQLGNGQRTDSGCDCVFTPAQVAGLPPIRSVHTGGRHSLAVALDGSVWVWGSDDHGQMGDGPSSVRRLTPFQVPSLGGVTAAAVRGSSSLVLKDDGTIWGWGYNSDGKLGTTTGEYCNSYECIAAPTQLNELRAGAIATGGGHQLAIQLPGAAAEPVTCTPGVIDGEFVVMLADSVVDPEAVANELAQQLGLSVFHVYRSVFKGFAAQVPSDSLDALKADSRVQVVEQDKAGCVSDAVQSSTPGGVAALAQATTSDQIASTGLKRIGGSTDGKYQTLKHKGTNVGIAVLDSGVDFDHPDVEVRRGPTCVPNTVNADDDHGHGTHVAGIIAARDNGIGTVGVAPEATIYAVKVGDKTGWTPQSRVICGVEWVLENADTIQVVNMSLGISGSVTPSNEDCSNSSEDEDLLHTAICLSVKQGVTFVVSAGNDAESALRWRPAGYEEVITVSSLADFDGKPGGHYKTGNIRFKSCKETAEEAGKDPLKECNEASFRGCTETVDDSFACYSNFGAAVDIAAPGINIYSTVPTGSCVMCKSTGYLTQSGTSMAAPFVAGAAALYKQQHPNATPKEVKEYLIDHWEQGPIPEDPDTSKEGILYIGEPEAYVANEGDGTVSVVNGDQITTVTLTPTASKLGPFDLAISPAADYVYAVHGIRPGAVAVIDTAKKAQVGEWKLNAPRKVAVNPVTERVVVIDSDTPIFVDWLRVIDGKREELLGSVELGATYFGRDLAFSPDGKLLYVLVRDMYGPSKVRLFDGHSYQHIAEIPVPDHGNALAISPGGNHLYVLHADNRVSVLDTETRAVTETVSLATRPSALAIMPFLLTGYIANPQTNSVSVIDTRTNQMEATVQVGVEPRAVAVDEYAFRVYVANRGSNTLSVIEPGTNRLVTTLTVGKEPVDVVTRR